MTNADFIRQFSDLQLARFLFLVSLYISSQRVPPVATYDSLIEWLHEDC